MFWLSAWIVGLFVSFVSVSGWILLWVVFAETRLRRYYRENGIDYRRLDARGFVHYYLGFYRAVVTIVWWHVRGRLGEPGVVVEATGPTVLCVHGFLLSRSAMWGVRRALATRGRPSVAVSLGRPLRPIEEYSRAFAEQLREAVASDPTGRVDIVAHSMGGLVVRRALQSDPALAADVRRIVTVGSPHRGTSVSRHVHAPDVQQMGRESEFLAALPELGEIAPQAEVITVSTTRDLVVFPPETTRQQGARSVVLEEVSHLALLTRRESIERIVAALSAGDESDA